MRWPTARGAQLTSRPGRSVSLLLDYPDRGAARPAAADRAGLPGACPHRLAATRCERFVGAPRDDAAAGSWQARLRRRRSTTADAAACT
ncbi:MAG: hypothetical protein WKF47_16435 [Geodermatophilaceae bacterium]